MKQKSQAATEFLILFMIMMGVFSATVFMSMQRSQDLADTKIGLESMSILNDVSNKINIAFLEGDGFMINLTLPQQIFGKDYTISMQSNYMILEISNTTYFKSLMTDNITGTLQTGTNLIENKKGVVMIS